MSKPVRNSEVISRDEQNKTVLFDSRSGEIYLVNSTATYVWSLCGGSLDSDEIANAVSTKFNAKDRDVKADVKKLLDRLSELGLVEFR